MVVAAEFEQAGMKADSLAVAFEDDGLEIIVVMCPRGLCGRAGTSGLNMVSAGLS
jgi:hypothetical protein